jgi:myo-inositol-1(or 4)-monophosphatase
MNTEEVLSQYMLIVEEAIDTIQPLLFAKRGGEIVVEKADGDVTRKIDLIVEDLVKQRTKLLGLSVQFISEECGVLDLSPSPDFALVLDPIDGTDMAVRGYPLCAISLSLHYLDTMNPIIAVIGDIFQKKLYYASEDGAFLKQKGDVKNLKPACVAQISDAMVVSYAAKPHRLLSLLDQRELIKKVKLFFNYGGPLDIARVGEGTVDAFVEFEKGFKIIDYAAGIYIAQMAGAVVTDLHGSEVKLTRDLDARQKFLVSCSQNLHEEILSCLDNKEQSIA